MTVRTVLIFGLVALFSFAAQAQSRRGTVTGTVTDADGAPLPGVQIADPSLQRGTTSGSDGQYTLSGLPSGTHTLRFTFVGYQTAIRNVTLDRGETVTLDVTLKTKVLETEGVTVTGTPRARSTLRTAQSVDVIGPEELETTRTAALGRTLEERAGISSIQTGSQAGKPVLRGLSGNRIVILKEGISQEFFQFGVRHAPPTSANEAEQIEVVRGASSILYGSDALGGAINIRTKEPPTAPRAESKIGGRVGTQYFANNNERTLSLDLNGARGNVGVRIGMERRIADNFNTPSEPTFFETGNGGTFGDPKYTGEVPFTNFEQTSGYGQVGYDGSFGTVQLYGDYWLNQQNFLLPNGGPDDDDPATPPPAGLAQNLEHGNAALRATLLAGDYVVKPTVSLQRSVRQSAAPGTTTSDVDEEGGFNDFAYPIDLKLDVFTARMDVQHPPAWGRLSGTVGTEVQIQDGSSRGPVELQPTADELTVGAFVLEDLDLGALTLTSGIRFDYHTIDAAANDRTNNPDLLEQSFTTVTGSVGANYLLREGIAVAANVGSGFRTPSLFELFAEGVEGGVAAFQRGNPTLDAERTFSSDLSLRVRRDRITGEVTGYVNLIRNYIFLENTQSIDPGSGLPVFSRDQTDALIGGFEGRIDVQVRPWIRVGGTASLLHSEGDDLGEGDRDGALPLIPADRMSGFVRIQRDEWRGLVDPFWKISVKRAFDKDAAGRFEPFSQFDGGFGPSFGTASTKSSTLVNLEVGMTLPFLEVPIGLTVSANNVFNVAHRDFLDTYKGYALSQGRHVQLSLSASF